MSDINKRAGEEECGDGRKRGKRGHRGHDGAPGPTGPTGPSDGPTGPTGPQGPTGSGNGLAAYGYAVNFGQSDVLADQSVLFSLGGLVFPNVGITVPAPNGSAFTILSEGDYEYIFYAVAQHGEADSLTMQFAIYVNGINQGTGHEFNSNFAGDGNDIQLIRGQGIIHLLVGDVVTLRNRTGFPTTPTDVQLISSIEANNATFSLKKLSA